MAFISGCISRHVSRRGPLEGLYGGIALGLMTLDGTDSFSQAIINNPAPINFDTDLSGDKLSYGLFLGYGREVWGPLVLGGEIYCDFARPKSSYRVFAPVLAGLPGADGVFGDNESILCSVWPLASVLRWQIM